MNAQCNPPRRPQRILAAPVMLRAALCLVMSILLATTAAAQNDTGKKKSVLPREGSPSSPELDVTDDGLPRDIGQILEVSEAELQSGNRTMRYLRRIANATYDWLLHLRISVVESDPQAIRYDRENCELLFELIGSSNPSRILRDDLTEIGNNLDLEDGLSSCVLGLQLDLEKYDLLYPLADFRPMVTALLKAQREGKPQQVKLGIQMMDEAMALPNIDGPIAGSRATFDHALELLDAGNRDGARKEIKKAANLISLLNVGAYVTESLWHLAKANEALQQRLFGIALASLKKADARLDDAEDRAWPEYATAVAGVRKDLDRILTIAADSKLKYTLEASQLRELAQRIDRELRIPY
jgi:hypothetical protein